MALAQYVLVIIGVVAGAAGFAMMYFTPPGTGDGRWLFRTPVSSSVGRILGGAGFVLLGIWLFLLVADRGYLPLRHGAHGPAVIGYLLAAIVVGLFGAVTVYVVATLVVGPAHAPMALEADDRGVTVHDGLNAPLFVSWDRLGEVYGAGTRKDGYFTIDYVDENGVARHLQKRKYQTGGDPVAMAAALNARRPGGTAAD
ncbi:MAG: hypothetical protein QM774_00025 [Gordonia sp. (in: high G+C Gram-positive bacteria)]|uniref:hypothetical protein n=1 Tax=Gordonia sp. (in: high G+C Gram-positive bacteria) TaxID=84139 RepID=UPI0039E3151C